MSGSVYAVVLNWNNYLDTRECILSIGDSVDRIVLVDNGSSHECVSRLRRDFGSNPAVHIIQNATNVGFAAGVNIGILYSLERGANYILLVNNDVVLDGECVTLLLDILEKNPKAGLAGPRIFYYKEPDRIWLGGGYFSYLRMGIYVPEKGKRTGWYDLAPRRVDFVTGCVVLIKSTVFERVGLFDDRYYFYEEDADMCIRARKAGFEIWYVPRARAWHKIEDIARDRSSPFVMYNLARSRMLFLRKHFGPVLWLWGLALHFVVYTPFRALQIMRGSQSVAAFLEWVRGTKDGLMVSVRLTR
jgi:GT2 family glycosyltransferase